MFDKLLNNMIDFMVNVALYIIYFLITAFLCYQLYIYVIGELK